MITLTRAQIGKADGLDITVKSSVGVCRLLAPTWTMVMDYKSGNLSEQEYKRIYKDILLAGEDRWLAFLMSQDSPLVLLCYCPDGRFCHTHLLIDYLVTRHADKFIDGR